MHVAKVRGVNASVVAWVVVGLEWSLAACVWFAASHAHRGPMLFKLADGLLDLSTYCGGQMTRRLGDVVEARARYLRIVDARDKVACMVAAVAFSEVHVVHSDVRLWLRRRGDLLETDDCDHLVLHVDMNAVVTHSHGFRSEKLGAWRELHAPSEVILIVGNCGIHGSQISLRTAI